MEKNKYLVTEVTEGNQHGLFILTLDKGVHIGEQLAKLLEERYGQKCTHENTHGTVAQTFVDVVYAGSRKESYRLDNYTHYDRSTDKKSDDGSKSVYVVDLDKVDKDVTQMSDEEFMEEARMQMSYFKTLQDFQSAFNKSLINTETDVIRII